MGLVGNIISSIVLCGVFLFAVNSVYSIYTIFHPLECDLENSTGECVPSHCDCSSENLTFHFFYGNKGKPNKYNHDSSHQHVLTKRDIPCNEGWSADLNLVLPQYKSVSYLHAFVVCHKSYDDKVFIGENTFAAHKSTQLAELLEEKVEKHLVGETAESEVVVENENSKKKKPKVLHVHRHARVHVLGTPFVFNTSDMLPEFYQHLHIVRQHNANSVRREYTPIEYIDELSRKRKDYLSVETLKSADNYTGSFNFTLIYSPISMGKLRLIIHMEQSFKMLKQVGFTATDMEDVASIFTDANFYLLALTMVVSIIHLLLDFLSFKNDIQFWRKRGTAESNHGLSSRAVVWRFVSNLIIFLYLLQEKASAIICLPAAVSVIIEVWKISKFWRLKTRSTKKKNKSWFESFTSFSVVSLSDVQTEEVDSQATYYLKILILPLCAGFSIYSLLFYKRVSFYSWLISSMVKGVYFFGFVLMMPQLMLNYRLKSVAHLPWRAFIYKALNTFIDDLFVFIIDMPTSHRLACFRDDIIFFIYLYQSWIYKVDYDRKEKEE